MIRPDSPELENHNDKLKNRINNASKEKMLSFLKVDENDFGIG